MSCSVKAINMHPYQLDILYFERKLPNYEFCVKENQVQRTQLNNMRRFKGDLHSIRATK